MDFERAFDRERAGLLRLALRLTRNDRDQSEDLVQTTALSAFKHLDQIRPETMGAYCAAILRRAHLDILRAERRNPSPILASDLPDDRGLDAIAAPEPREDPAQAYMVRRAINTLRNSDRQVIELKYYEQLTYEEIAIRTGVSRQTSWSRVGRAITKLSACLN